MGYEQLLIWQYKDKPKAVKLMTGLSSKVVQQQDALVAVSDALDIDTAIGKNLDLVGEHVGLTRYASGLVPLYLFGFKKPQGGMSVKRASGARFYRYGGRTSSSARLDDPEYRMFLKATIAKTWSNGDILSIQEAADFILGQGTTSVQDSMDMTISVLVAKDLTPLEKFALTDLDLLPRPPGVGIKFILGGSQDLFGFKGSRFAQPFGKGKFARFL